MYGELNPQGGGDPIPLLEKTLTIGRRESCDIVLRFANVSGKHCQLSLEDGYWYAQDMNSQNGTKVNGAKIMRKRLDPGDTLAVAKHKYTIQYSPKDLGASGPPPSEQEDITNVLGKSLLERAGLNRRPESGTRRYDPTTDAAGQMRKNYENEK